MANFPRYKTNALNKALRKLCEEGVPLAEAIKTINMMGGEKPQRPKQPKSVQWWGNGHTRHELPFYHGDRRF